MKRDSQTNRNKKVEALAVAAAIGVAAIALILGTRGGGNSKSPAAEPPTVDDTVELSVATKFFKAFGAFDGEQAITYSHTPMMYKVLSPTAQWCRSSPGGPPRSIVSRWAFVVCILQVLDISVPTSDQHDGHRLLPLAD